jgi:hypothetical protein
MRLGQTKLTTHDVGAFHHRDALVVRDPPAQSFATEAAIGGDHQLLGRDKFQSAANQPCDIFRRFHHRVAMVHYADADLLVGLVLTK